MPPRNPAQMTAEELAAKVTALKPEWARTYILRLEAITRHLAAQLQAAQAQGAGDLNLAREISGARDRLAEQVQIPFYAQFSAWARGTAPIPPGIPDARRAFPGIPDPILAACFRQLSQETPGLLLGEDAFLPPATGITPPDGEYATVRLVDGTANMTPVADLPDKAEIRFADFYQAHYGDHDDTGGMRVLVIEGDDAIIVHPVSKTTVLISRGDQDQRA